MCNVLLWQLGFTLYYCCGDWKLFWIVGLNKIHFTNNAALQKKKSSIFELLNTCKLHSRLSIYNYVHKHSQIWKTKIEN